MQPQGEKKVKSKGFNIKDLMSYLREEHGGKQFVFCLENEKYETEFVILDAKQYDRLEELETSHWKEIAKYKNAVSVLIEEISKLISKDNA